MATAMHDIRQTGGYGREDEKEEDEDEEEEDDDDGGDGDDDDDDDDDVGARERLSKTSSCFLDSFFLPLGATYLS